MNYVYLKSVAEVEDNFMNYYSILLTIKRLIIGLLPILLVACTHQQSHGPDHYVVRGKTYHVMKSAKHYKAKGIASWYGPHARHQKHQPESATTCMR